MMWKDSYRLGVERIDRQHIELFRMTEDLVNAVKNGATVEAYQKALGFLKDYVIYHFRDEEAYQASIHYADLEAHRAEHQQFTQVVLDYEKRLTECGFDEKTMKELAGAVTAWLIYHVVDTDQKIVAEGQAPVQEPSFDRYVDLVSDSALEVLSTMAGIDREHAQSHAVSPNETQGDVVVKIPLVGDWKGTAVFGFSQELALQLLESMTGMEVTQVDELVQSALCELTNIACGNAATALVKRGLQCDIKPPVIGQDMEDSANTAGTRIDTGSGWLDIDVQM